MTVCNLCIYNPPSSADGKPCTMCPASTNTEVKAVPIEVLHEIRAKIDSYCSDNRDRNDGLYIAMRIIDKHLKEYEDAE